MTEDDVMTALDGLEFDENNRTWLLEVEQVDDGNPGVLAVTVRVGNAGTMQVDIPRHRRLAFSAMQDHVIAIAREIAGGRRQPGARTAL
jgi:hypothetical protein